MKNILFLGQKGGTGKSTLSAEMVFSFKRTDTPSAFYDLDQQGQILEGYEDKSAKVAVIDTPGALLEDMPKWIAEADVIILPTRASALDIPPLLRTYDIVKANRKKKAKIILLVNGFTRFTACRDFMEWIEQQDFDVYDILTIPQSEIVIQASAGTKSIVEFAPKNSSVRKSALKFVNAVRVAVGLPTEDI